MELVPLQGALTPLGVICSGGASQRGTGVIIQYKPISDIEPLTGFAATGDATL